ncbi:MAG: DUF423 domain-containing protein [Zunongwangia sp.]|jgi:uncharacterized membrane protein YgdD (TMEM256/DUF423 family)|uniref:Membrane protein n=2 Tax=Zunongwangia profunda TaxID=398743 RepID=D5BEW5_ZUNPS|nr:DUF423 domain-containing protein [Zunongwangia profunda]MAC64840.1 DUF423 domain-containing protein [Flavobacteriaceae bacterium]MAO36044.1 DUF423 domain-containing protein [Zunongwangia sp.]ADF50844.1 membrane protein [Zunongwangia profunda SM-A87]MAG88342.1 DUF423 domain-containing protein [Flavobacteriaceae bacterium]MAS72411.1 DUF423 domain-containing protein [Zunongwangia sp.]|tara:strand:+ start:9490 stop:9870 length:381 start_codon:yes stop_codon:yes gene_type:complete
MTRKFLVAGGIFGLFGVILGAFGAHGLKNVLDADTLTSFETGVRYQIYHALLLIGLANFTKLQNNLLFWFFTIGSIFFSGSIYLLSLDELAGLDFSSIALVTPLGGALLIVGWTLLIFKSLRLNYE